MIPEKKSKSWYFIILCYTIIIFIGIIITRFMVGTTLSLTMALSTLILSLISALVPCLAGFWGRHVFYSVFACINLIALLYMFYIVISDATPGWGDLTSIIGYLFILVVGFGIALISDIIYYIRKKAKS